MTAIVPARSGSQRLPNKNQLILGGMTLFDRAITSALGSTSVTDVVCTTDDPVLLNRKPHSRVTLLRRSEHLATATATTLDVVMDVIGRIPAADIIVLLQPTSPFRRPADIDACLDLLHSHPTCPSVTTVCATEHPIEWTFDRDGDLLTPVFGWDRFGGRSQDHATRFRLNGAVYAARSEHLAKGGAFVEQGTRMVEMPHLRSVDIDTEADYQLAVALLQSGVLDDPDSTAQHLDTAIESERES